MICKMVGDLMKLREINRYIISKKWDRGIFVVLLGVSFFILFSAMTGRW